MRRQHSPEFRQRAVRLVMDQREQTAIEYEAIRKVAAKLGVGRRRSVNGCDAPRSILVSVRV